MTDTMQPGSWTRPPEVEAILAVGSLLLFGLVFWAVIYVEFPPGNKEYAFLMLGALIGVVKDTFGRYFQATKGAAEQRRESAKVAERAAETAAVLATVQAASTPQPEGTATITTAPDVDVSLRRPHENLEDPA